jgi:hypothetical protein
MRAMMTKYAGVLKSGIRGWFQKRRLDDGFFFGERHFAPYCSCSAPALGVFTTGSVIFIPVCAAHIVVNPFSNKYIKKSQLESANNPLFINQL